MSPETNPEQPERLPPTIERSVRFDTETLLWFDQHFPWRGSISQLCNQVLMDFREAWGDSPPPTTVVRQVTRKLVLLKDKT
jgi:hypothetical protein